MTLGQGILPFGMLKRARIKRKAMSKSLVFGIVWVALGASGLLRAQVNQAVAAVGVAAKAEPLSETIPTVGTLRANESVDVVSELSRRLVKVQVEEGSEVKAGQVLFKLDDSDLKAEINQIDAKRRLAQGNEQRNRELLASKAISQQDYDASKADLDVVEAEHAAKAVELDKTEIRAPFAGRIGRREVSEGAWVSPTIKLVNLQDLARIKVDFPLPARYADEIHPGLPFTFTVAGNTREYKGLVKVVEPRIDPDTRSLLVRGECSAPDAALVPGAFAEVTLKLDAIRDGLDVPAQAVVPSARGQGVYVAKAGKAVLVDVVIGLRTPEKVVVTRGLAEGDVVLTTSLLRLRPGLEVKVLPPEKEGS